MIIKLNDGWILLTSKYERYFGKQLPNGVLLKVKNFNSDRWTAGGLTFVPGAKVEDGNLVFADNINQKYAEAF